jgi:hypothetical protein
MPTHHIVRAGDCVSSIAYDYGHHPDTLWNAAENAALKALRKNPNVLLPGDVVVVPDLRDKAASAATGQRHRFRRRAVPERLQVDLHDESGPRAGLHYTVVIDGVEVATGTTGADGRVAVPIVPNARVGLIQLEGAEKILLDLGDLAPVEELVGVQMRLHNLGYATDDTSASSDEDALLEALVRSQEDQGLPVSGEPDDATRAALVAVYGG